MASLAEQAKKLLEQEKIQLASKVSQRCVLCRLAGDQKEALEVLLVSRRDTNSPTMSKMKQILTALGIHTNPTSLRVHFEEHWDGKEKVAKPKSR